LSKLRVKKVGIDTYHENIAYLSFGCELCKSQGFGALSKIEVRGDGKSILATLNMTENGLVKSTEIGLSDIAFERLGMAQGTEVSLSHPNPLLSYDYVRQKLEGKGLDKRQFLEILGDIVGYRYSNIELTAFVIACSQHRLNETEIQFLSEAMIETGQRIDWDFPLVLDKHCIGGVPGNRTTMIVVPIIAAFGLHIPKTSSRAITSPSGTADTMETIANVRLSLPQMRQIVAEENACIAWGGSLTLAPADDILISVERPLNLDSTGQMIASILSKKRSAGSNRMVLDIPIGPTAKVRSLREAERLKELFQNIGGRIGLQIRVIFTDGTQPVGRGIGPSLEARDVLRVLENSQEQPKDLREKSIFLAGELLEFSGEVAAGQGAPAARKILDSGEAFEKFHSIALKQGGFKRPELASLSTVVASPTQGLVQSIHNQKIAMVAKLAGAPHDARAGVFLGVKLGEAVAEGAPLFTIYAESGERLRFSMDYVAANRDILVVR